MNLVDREHWLTPNTIPPMPRSGVATWSELAYKFRWNQGEEVTFPNLIATVKIGSLELSRLTREESLPESEAKTKRSTVEKWRKTESRRLPPAKCEASTTRSVFWFSEPMGVQVHLHQFMFCASISIDFVP